MPTKTLRVRLSLQAHPGAQNPELIAKGMNDLEGICRQVYGLYPILKCVSVENTTDCK